MAGSGGHDNEFPSSLKCSEFICLTEELLVDFQRLSSVDLLISG